MGKEVGNDVPVCRVCVHRGFRVARNRGCTPVWGWWGLFTGRRRGRRIIGRCRCRTVGALTIEQDTTSC